MSFDKSDLMVVLVKPIESYVILDKNYLTVVLRPPKDSIKAFHFCDKFFAPIGIVDGEFKPVDRGTLF